jgi:hypothetical protein
MMNFFCPGITKVTSVFPVILAGLRAQHLMRSQGAVWSLKSENPGM